MEVLAWVLGILGGLCTVMGIVTAVGVIPPLGAALTLTFWFMLSGILFLACISALVARREYE